MSRQDVYLFPPKLGYMYIVIICIFVGYATQARAVGSWIIGHYVVGVNSLTDPQLVYANIRITDY
jgi:hypothetical protein